MLHSLIKIGIGVVVGAVLVKENREASSAYDKVKTRIKELIEKLSSKTEVPEKSVAENQTS